MTRTRFAPSALLALAIMLTSSACTTGVAQRNVGAGGGVAGRDQRITPCFDVSGLAPDDRTLAEQVLREFGDREGLYTLASGIKPISSDVRDLRVRIAPTADSLSLAKLDQQRRVAAALSCGNIGLLVQVFTATQRAKDSSEVRNSSMVVYHRASLRRLIERQPQFFATLGVTPATHPHDILAAVENAPRAARWRGYGYLFGYPDAAVDFFVEAGVEGDRSGKLVPRDFRRIETVYKFADGEGDSLSTFVYAVPKGAPVSAGEQQLRERAALVMREYRARRARHFSSDSTGAIELWRRWLTSSTAPTAR